MKNKRIIIGIALSFVLIVGVIAGLFLMNNKSKVITIDINPSIELTITKGKVKVEALTEDGTEFTGEEWQGLQLEDYLDKMVERVMDLNLIEDNNIVIIVGMNKQDKKITNSIKEAFKKKDITANIIIPKITNESKKEAKKYGITPAKAAYILELKKANNDLQVKDLVTTSATDLNEMKEKGLYCEDGYNLVHGFCETIIKKEPAKEGKTCPENYELVNDICYKTDTFEEELYCETGFTLNKNKCSGTVSEAAKVKCDSGTYNESSKICETYNFVAEGTKYCNGDGKISQKGTCSYGKPLINGGCIGSDVVIGGMCYNMIDGGSDYALINCPSGSFAYEGSKGRACYNKTTSSPTYYCEGGTTLNGTICSGNVTKDAERKMTCADGYTLYEQRFCINYNDTTASTIGLTCPREASLEEDQCIYRERVDAKQK